MNGRVTGATCFECGKRATHFHHVIPAVLGGKRTLGLCDEHHGLLHSVTFIDGTISHSTLVKRGIRNARNAGTTLGRPPVNVVEDDCYKRSVSCSGSRVVRSKQNNSQTYAEEKGE